MANRDDSTAGRADKAGFTQDLCRIAESVLDEQKSRLAETGHGIAAAFRQAADTLQESHITAAAQHADHAAARLDDWSTTLREQGWTDLVEGAESFARREPALFVVGAVAAGFLLGRFFSASAEPREGQPEKPVSPDYAAGSTGSLA